MVTVASIAAAAASAGRPGSVMTMTSTRASSGSRLSRSGHLLQRGRPCRSRNATCRVFPQPAHSSGRTKQGAQYQCSPRRCIEVTRRPQSAHHGGEIPVAPAARSASMRSPATLEAGDCPVVSTDGSPASSAARRRRLERPPPTRSTIRRTRSCSRAGSAAVTRQTTAPTGSASASAGAVTSQPARSAPAWAAGPRRLPRRRLPWPSWQTRRRRRRAR